MLPNNSKKGFSLRENCKLRILKDMLGALKQANPTVPNYIMVVDQTAARIISSCIKMIELMEEGVLVLEKLDLDRKKFPSSHAIYFMAPNETGISRLKNDFKDKKKPQYSTLHIFFTNKLSQDLLDHLSKEPELLKRISTLKEMNLDFLCPEDNLFHLDMPEALPVIFSKYGLTEEKNLTDLIADKLSTVIPTIFDFKCFQIIFNKNNRNGASERVALRLYERLNKFLELKSKEQKEEEAGPIKIVVLDRSIDPLTPLLHDYYYQAMIYDLLDIKGDLVEYQSEDSTGKQSKKRTILSDNDELWVKYKYKHIAEAMMGLTDEFNKYVESNTTSKLKKGELGEMDLKKMVDIVKQMPLYQDQLNKYTMHMNLMEQCMKIFNSKSLFDIGDIEQSVASGIDKEGKEVNVQKIFQQILTKIAEGKLKDDAERLRLIMIALIALGLPEKMREELTKKLDIKDETTLTKLVWLGVDPQKASDPKDKKSKKVENPLKGLVKERMAKISYDLVRYIPQIELLSKNFISNTYDPKAYEAFNIPKSYDGSFGSKSKISGMNIASLRKGGVNTAPTWNKNSDEKSQPKIIFFIIGGISYAEIRVLREFEMQNQFCNVLIGATALIKPNEYIEGIEKMMTSLEHNDLRSKAGIF